MRLIPMLAVPLLLLCGSRVASADVVRWTITGSTLSDGGSLTGYFDLIAPLPAAVITAADITSGSGGSFGGANYPYWSYGLFTGSNFSVFVTHPSPNAAGFEGLRIEWASDIGTTAGGTVAITSITEGICATGTCDSFSTVHRTGGTLGSLVGVDTTVPEPSTAGVVLMGVLAMLGVRRTRTRRLDRTA